MKATVIIILISVIGIIYLPFKIFYLKSKLIPIKEVIKNVEKSHTRIPYYKFKVQRNLVEYYNSGNGLLSFFKNDEKILKRNINNELKFYINKEYTRDLEKNNKIFYIGLHNEHVYIDIFYYYFTGLGKFLFFLFCILIMCLNLYGVYVIKNRIFEIFLMYYIFYSIIILIL